MKDKTQEWTQLKRVKSTIRLGNETEKGVVLSLTH